MNQAQGLQQTCAFFVYQLSTMFIIIRYKGLIERGEVYVCESRRSSAGMAR